MSILSKLKTILFTLKTITNCNQCDKKQANPFISIDDEIWLKTVQYHMRKSINSFDFEELQNQLHDLNETMIDTNQYLVHYTLLKLNSLGLYQHYNLIIYNVKNLQNGNLQNIMDVNRNLNSNYIQFA